MAVPTPSANPRGGDRGDGLAVGGGQPGGRVHCVDTEGPLQESLEATFDRLAEAKGVRLDPHPDTLAALQSATLDLGGREAEVADFLAPARLAYLSRWAEIEEMVRAVTAPAFRAAHASPDGTPYTFTWFIVDNVGFAANPRRKATGVHTVWDAYQRLLADNAAGDALAWHFHAIGGAGNPLRYNTTWTANDWPEQVLARRILERGWFPNAFRAGGNIERNDLSLWLEQFIPFDFSNRAHADDPGGPGAMWDWRHAPADWSPYHPDHDDYRRAGGMRRAIFRAVDIDSARCRLEADDVARAFARTAAGTTTVLAYSNHDRRDMRPEIARASALIRGVAARYPDVGWRYATAPEAARVALGRPSPAADLPLDLALRAEGGRLWIESSRPLFGPMPFLAVEETGGLVFRDNPTIEGPTLWCYRPDSAAVLRVGVGRRDKRRRHRRGRPRDHRSQPTPRGALPR